MRIKQLKDLQKRKISYQSERVESAIDKNYQLSIKKYFSEYSTHKHLKKMCLAEDLH